MYKGAFYNRKKLYTSYYINTSYGGCHFDLMIYCCCISVEIIKSLTNMFGNDFFFCLYWCLYFVIRTLCCCCFVKVSLLLRSKTCSCPHANFLIAFCSLSNSFCFIILLQLKIHFINILEYATNTDIKTDTVAFSKQQTEAPDRNQSNYKWLL